MSAGDVGTTRVYAPLPVDEHPPPPPPPRPKDSSATASDAQTFFDDSDSDSDSNSDTESAPEAQPLQSRLDRTTPRARTNRTNRTPRSTRLLAPELASITEASATFSAYTDDPDPNSNSGFNSGFNSGINIGNGMDDLGPKDYSNGSGIGGMRSESELDFGNDSGLGGGGGMMIGAATGAADVKEGRQGDVLGMVLVVAGLVTLVLGTWLIVFLNNPSSLGYFAGHPPLQVVAIACFTLAILQLQPTSQPRTKARGLTRHQLLILCIGAPAIITGTALIYGNKVIHESSHFTTWHATFGLIALVWMVGQILLGGLSVWAGGRALGGGAKAKKAWRYHRASGYALLPLFLVTAAVGGNYSSWTASVVGVGWRVLVFTLAPVAVVVGVVMRIRTSKMNFRQ